MTSAYTRVIPFQWQNPLLAYQLNSHSQAQKPQSRRQHITRVTPHAGQLAQLGEERMLTWLPSESSATLGTPLVPEQ